MRRVENFPDIVRDAHLETEFIDARTTKHIRYKAGTSARQRRLRKEEQWTRSCELGRGAYGIVYLETRGQDDKLRKRAVKEIRKYIRPGQPLDYDRELEAIFKFSHDRYAHCFVTADGWYDDDDSVYISMEYFELGDLHAHLMARKKIPEYETRQIAMQLLDGLAFMHENNFVHRDLKPGNIMVVATGPEWYVKIADFGISKRRREDVSTVNTMGRGTYGYAAPEVLGLGDTPENASYTFLVDMWSLGAVLYKLLTSETAFGNIVSLLKYAEREIDFPSPPLNAAKVSELGSDFILALMSPQPPARPPAASAKVHPWFFYSIEAPARMENGGVSSIDDQAARSDDEKPFPDDSRHDSEASIGQGARGHIHPLHSKQPPIAYHGPYIEPGTDDSLRGSLPHLPADGRTILRTASPGDLEAAVRKGREEMINKCDNSSPGSAAQKNSEPEQHPREVSQSGHAKDLDKDDPTTNDLVIAASSDSDASEASDNNFTHATRPSAPRRLTFYSKTEGFHEQVELNNLTRFGDMKTTCFSCGKTVKRKDGRSNELECGHVQCIPCLERKFKQAIKDPAAMPAVCCTNEPIPLTLMALCDLPPNFREDFTRKMVEYGRKRISCPVEECLADVQLETAKYRRGSDGSIVVTCDVCHTQICCDCKNEKHFSSCIQDTGTRKLLTLLEAERVIQIVDLDAAEQGRQGRASARRQSRIGNTCWHCNKAYNWNTFEVAQCGHSFCHPCLLGWFLVGLVLPQHNPPRCCNLEIGLACYRRILVNPWLNSAWLAQHEIAETGSWTCPTGAHVPKNLYITSTAPAVWKPRVQCEGCGPNHGIYCIRCKAKWHRTECWEFRSIEELERRLWQVDIIDESFLQQLSAGISYERKLRSGDKVSQFHRAQKFLDCRTEAQQVIRQEIPRPSAVQTEYPQAGALSESDWEEEDEEEEDEARDWEYAPYSPRGYGHDEWHDPYARNRMRGGHWADEVDTY